MLIRSIVGLSLSAMALTAAGKLVDNNKSLPSSVSILVGGTGAITTLKFDSKSKKFGDSSVAGSSVAGKNPTFFVLSPDHRFLFATDEIEDYEGRTKTGSVSSLKISKDGVLKKISSASSGSAPVSVDVSPDGKNIIVACYTGASAQRFAIDKNGALTTDKPVQSFFHNNTGPNPQRQTQSYIHQAKYDHTGKLAFFTDLGGDRVYIHKVIGADGALSEVAHEIKVKAGSGPRHLSIVQGKDANKYDIYLICELSNQIYHIKLTQSSEGALESKIIQAISTLPDDQASQKTFGAGEISVSKDGKYVYGTNRQTDDTRPITENSIVKFTRNPSTGGLDAATRKIFPLEVGGKIPRHFSFSNDENESLVVVGCQLADTVLIYSRDPSSGELKLLGSTDAVKAPAVQMFIETNEAAY